MKHWTSSLAIATTAIIITFLSAACAGIDVPIGAVEDDVATGDASESDEDGDKKCNPAKVDCDEDGYIGPDADCAPFDENINVGADEVCDNAVDDDCDGDIDSDDNGCDEDENDGDNVCETKCPSVQSDVDCDGYCTGYGDGQTDCNDQDIAVHPGATEICGDSKDNNCNGLADENCGGGGDNVCQTQCPAAQSDVDCDGYCTGYGDGQTDCNDQDIAVHPGATEICGDSKDNNCNGLADENCGGGGSNVCQTQCLSGQFDADCDGYCTNYGDGQTDCNDQDIAVHPGATEICDNKDNDCDGQVDEGCKAEVEPPAPNGDALSCKIVWSGQTGWLARYQIVYHKSDLFGWWDNPFDAAVLSDQVTMIAAHVESDLCGVRLQTANSTNTEWLAFGHKSTQTALHPNIGVSCVYKDKTATKANLVVVSHPGGVAYGSSAYWDLRPNDPNCPHGD